MYKTLLQSKVHSQGHIDGCLLHRLLWHILSWTNHEGDFCVCEAELRTKAEHDMFGFEKQKWVESVFTNSQQWRLTEYDSYVFLGLASLSLGPLGTSAQAQWGSCNEERCAQKFCVLHLCRKLVFFLSNPLSLETLNDIWQGQMKYLNFFYFSLVNLKFCVWPSTANKKGLVRIFHPNRNKSHEIQNSSDIISSSQGCQKYICFSQTQNLKTYICFASTQNAICGVFATLVLLRPNDKQKCEWKVTYLI